MERLKKEQEEKEHKKKEKAEAHLYTIIKVARDENLVEQIGKDIYFDLVDHDKVRSFRIQKKMPFNLLKEEVAKEFGIPVQFQRFWLWAKRQNHTYRPNRPLTPLEETQSVGQLREVPKKVHNAELKLFLEVELGLDLHPIAPPDKTKDDILLFFKLYDPEKVQLRYVGRLFVKSTGKPAEILSKLNEMGGYAPDEEIDLYEEIKFEPYVMCIPIDKTFTFRASQLGDGDIVCFQKPTPAENGAHIRYPDVPSFLDYVHNRHMSKPKHSIRALDFLEILLKADVQTGVQFANIENVQEKLAFVESKYGSASGITGEVNKAFNQKIELEQDVEVYTLSLTEAQKEEQKFLTCVTVQNSMIEELEKKLAAEKAILKELEEHYATHKTKMNEANNKREHAQKMLYDHLIHEKTWVKKALQAKKDLKSVEVTWVRIQQLLSLISG